MNRDLVLSEWRRARQTLRAAQLLSAGECPEDAVSRAYYAVLHATKAALAVHDIAATSHAGARRMFGLHLVRTGEVEAEWASWLGESADDRLAADYDSSVSVSDEEAREDVRRARRFLNRIRRYLLAKGFSEAELRRRTSRG
jgi:hypothetical protein